MTNNRNKRSPNTQSSSGASGTGDENRKIVDVKGVEDDTTSTRARHWLTNDVLAFVLVVSFVGLIAVAGRGLIDLSTVPTEIRVVYVSLVGAAGAWAFGEAAFRNWYNARKDDGN